MSTKLIRSVSTERIRPDSKRKSEIVTVRLDPKLKYLAELAARRHRRTLSSYIEWAIEDSLSRVHPIYDVENGVASFADRASDLWDVDEPDRFAKLALNYPDLLDHEEQRIWKLIRECGYLWRGRHRDKDGEWQWTVDERSLVFERFREHWETFRSVARGEKPASVLPTWTKHKASRKSELDDDIPF